MLQLSLVTIEWSAAGMRTFGYETEERSWP
jgi:hypothetical protein